MRLLLQRVSRAEVRVDERVTGRIGTGYLLLVGFTHTDSELQVVWMAEKVAGLRLFADAAGKMNLGLSDVGGALLVVSQFTLAAETRKGTRPGFSTAAAPTDGERLYDYFVAAARLRIASVATGRFGARMRVTLVNDGPVTFWLEVAPAHAGGAQPAAAD
jgi:D-tyrosyl-tRNA(Tyr) deacylase